MPLLTLLLVCGSAQAVEYAEVLSLDTLLVEADQAAQGVVSRTSSEWGTDGLIYTRIDLDTGNSLLQWKDTLVSFVVPGGRIGDVVLTIPGSPTFDVGDDVLVFLSGERLLGLGQGAFAVDEGVATRKLGA